MFGKPRLKTSGFTSFKRAFRWQQKTRSTQIAKTHSKASVLSRTPVKATVSQNRTTHGLNYNPATFRVLACEDQAQYDALLKALVDEQKPTDTTEILLVTAMAQHRWLLDRANRLQESCFDQETAQITDPKLFALYLRYATTHERAFHKCLNDLLKLRNQKSKQAIGFESEKRKKDRHESAIRLDEINGRREYVKYIMAEHRASKEIEADKKAKEAAQAA